MGLALTLERLNFELGRLKTGTPPRLAQDSINFDGLIPQPSDDPPTPFSFLNTSVANQDRFRLCHLTYTNPASHAIIRDTLHLNNHVTQDVLGPRYCPSIESKVLRFSHRDRHQVWLEPEGLDSVSGPQP